MFKLVNCWAKKITKEDFMLNQELVKALNEQIGSEFSASNQFGQEWY